MRTGPAGAGGAGVVGGAAAASLVDASDSALLFFSREEADCLPTILERSRDELPAPEPALIDLCSDDEVVALDVQPWFRDAFLFE